MSKVATTQVLIPFGTIQSAKKTIPKPLQPTWLKIIKVYLNYYDNDKNQTQRDTVELTKNQLNIVFQLIFNNRFFVLQ